MEQRLRLGVIGTGAIAEAIVDGVRAAGLGGVIHLSPRNAEVAATLAARHDDVRVATDNQEVVDRSDSLLLAVRHEHVPAVLGALRIPADRLVISAVAGYSIAALRALLPAGPEVVRSIPLPAVRDLRGVTPLYPRHSTAEAVFGALGGVLPAPDEASFDAMSAASATISGHFGYVRVVARWLADTGLPAADAEAFVRGMFAGAADSLGDRGLGLDDLVRDVETPGGLNEAVRSGWLDDTNQQRLRAALDDILRRVTG